MRIILNATRLVLKMKWTMTYSLHIVKCKKQLNIHYCEARIYNYWVYNSVNNVYDIPGLFNNDNWSRALYMTCTCISTMLYKWLIKWWWWEYFSIHMIFINIPVVYSLSLRTVYLYMYLLCITRSQYIVQEFQINFEKWLWSKIILPIFLPILLQ